MNIPDVSGIRYKHGDRTTEYLIHNLDEANDTKYYGFVDYRGAWLVMKLVTSTGVITYAVGKQAYATNWTGRAALTFGLISAVMP